MAKDRHEEQPQVFYIPHNFIDEGTVFGGMFKTRNAAEAIAILAGIGYPLFNWVSLPLGTKLSIIIIGVLPIAILALIGLNDGPLSEFIKDIFKHLTSQKDVLYRVYSQKEMKGEEKDEKPARKN